MGAFEKRVITKLPKNSGSKTEVDVAVIDEFTVLQSGNDVVICAVAANGENELVVLSLVEGVFSAISNCAHAGFLSSGLSKQFVLDNLADVLFILDEVTDEGIIMETEEELILNRIKMIDELESNSSAQADAVFQKATQNAKSKLLSSLMGRWDACVSLLEGGVSDGCCCSTVGLDWCALRSLQTMRWREADLRLDW